MKMSEFTTKSFLGNAGAAENSYILINYEDNTTQRPVTYKASLQEIGKAIANDQKLYKKTQNGAITTNVSQGAYVDTAAVNFASVGYVNTKTYDMITTSNIGLFTMGMASTGYVTSAINTAKNDLASVNYVENRFYGIASEGYVNNAISGLASENYVTEALEEAGGGFNPLESVTCSVFMAASASEADDHTVYPVMADRDGNLFQIYGYESTGLTIRDDIATTANITSAVNGLASTGYVTSEIDTAISDLVSTGDLTDAISGLASTGDLHSVPVQYSMSIFSVNGDHYAMMYESQYSKLPLLEESDDKPAIYDTNGIFQGHLLSTGYVTDAITTGVSTAIANAMQGTGVTKYGGGYLQYYDSAHVLNNITANMISGAASTGYVTSAISGLASTGYVTAAVANAGGGSFDPAESITCEFLPYGVDGSDPIEGNLLPVMADGNAFYTGAGNGTLVSRIPINKILFYEIEGNALLLKNKDNTTIHRIQLD